MKKIEKYKRFDPGRGLASSPEKER